LCSDSLVSSGWKSTTTKLSGDKGADVIATRNNVKIVLQCKKWQNAVGIKAVQEALSGRMYYDADFAFVVTNSTYTNDAWDFAIKTKVKLLHYSQLDEISGLQAT
jgi:restriction system protein